uniref:Permease n=1 Tax=Sciadococcus taiwanensis TaxID=3028030 RepID=A0A9Y1I249_9RHOD|nr:hypothetical protein SCTW_088 [Sciadococcus taiwanensis]
MMNVYVAQRILDIYLFKELLAPFIFGLCLFTFLGLCLGALFELVREIISGLSLYIAWQIFVFKIPFFIALALPMASLFSGLVAYNRLAKNNEFLALRSSGISLHRWLRASFFFGILVGTIYLLINEIIIPISNYSISTLYHKTLISNQSTSSISYTFHDKSKGVAKLSQFLYAKYFDGNFINDLILIEFSSKQPKSILIAESASLHFSTNTWICYNGQIHMMNNKTPYIHAIKFKTQRIENINFISLLTNIQYSPNWMNINTSKAYKKIFLLSNDLFEIRKLNIRIYQKYAAPIACLLLSLIGSILGSSAQNQNFSQGFGESLVIIFFYYISSFISEAIGLVGIAPPWLAGWLPNLGCIGIVILILAKEE